MNIARYLKFSISALLVMYAIFYALSDNITPFENLYVWLLLIIAICIIRDAHKIIKQHMGVDLLFVGLFFFSLLIPTFQIDNREISKQENRYLAKFPLLYENGKLNHLFGAEYDAWFKDRFFLRRKLIFFYNNLIYRISVFVYKNQKNLWIMKNSNYFLGPAGIDALTEQNTKTIAENLKKFEKSLHRRGIKFYIVTYPFPCTFYKDKNILYIKNPRKKPRRSTSVISDEKFAEILNKEYHLNYIDITPDFKKQATEDFVIYKTDHHPTDFGFFIMYDKLMSKIQKDFPDIEKHSLSDFNLSKNNKPWLSKDRIYKKFSGGAEYKISGIKDSGVFDTQYTFFEYKKIEDMDIKRMNQFVHIHKNPHGKHKLILFGDSSTEGFVYFPDTSFAETIQCRVNARKNPFAPDFINKIIDIFTPDAVVFLRARPNFPAEFSRMYDAEAEDKK